MEEESKNNKSTNLLRTIEDKELGENTNEEYEKIKGNTRQTFGVEVNSYGVLYSYPGKELVAKNHSKTFRIGEFHENYSRKCACCDKQMPTKFYSTYNPIKTKVISKYGIDLANFFIVIDNYYFYMIYFYISYLIQLLLCILLFGIPDVKFDAIYIELYYQMIIFDGRHRVLIDNIFNLIRIGIVLIVFRSINTKLKHAFNNYKKRVYDEFYIDESIYSIFIKNLPKMIDKEDLIKYLKEEYSLKSIKNVIILKEIENIVRKYDKLESFKETKKRMEVTNWDRKYKLEEFVELENNITKTRNKIKLLIEEAEKEKRSSGTAIVILEKNEEKNILFRKNFYTTKFLCCYKKIPHILKGKRIYFEVIPPIDQINWKYSKYSLEKSIAGDNFSSITSIIKFVLFSFLIFFFNFNLSKVTSIEIFNYNIFKIPFLRAFFLIFFNKFFQIVILACLSSFKLSDNYFHYILLRYIVMQKTFINTIIINIMLYQMKITSDFELEYMSFIYFIFLLAFKNILFTRFSERYCIQKIKYFFLRTVLRKKIIQVDLNEMYSDNNFEVIRVFEKYRLLVYTSLFLMKLFPFSAIFLFICIIIHYFTIKWSLFNSCLKNINYYGYFFNIIMRVEFTSLFLIITILSISSTFKNENYIIWYNVLFCVFSDIINIFHFKTSFNKFSTEKDYSAMESKFIRRFEEEKFVNFEILKNELNA